MWMWADWKKHRDDSGSYDGGPRQQFNHKDTPIQSILLSDLIAWAYKLANKSEMEDEIKAVGLFNMHHVMISR